MEGVEQTNDQEKDQNQELEPAKENNMEIDQEINEESIETYCIYCNKETADEECCEEQQIIKIRREFKQTNKRKQHDIENPNGVNLKMIIKLRLKRCEVYEEYKETEEEYEQISEGVD